MKKNNTGRALSDEAFAKVQEMQALCTQVEHDAAALRDLCKTLRNIHKRYVALETLYHADWLSLVEPDTLDAAQRQRIESMVVQGRYSILGQDTIWDALSDIRQEYITLLKTLAPKIS